MAWSRQLVPTLDHVPPLGKPILWRHHQSLSPHCIDLWDASRSATIRLKPVVNKLRFSQPVGGWCNHTLGITHYWRSQFDSCLAKAADCHLSWSPLGNWACKMGYLCIIFPRHFSLISFFLLTVYVQYWLGKDMSWVKFSFFKVNNPISRSFNRYTSLLNREDFLCIYCLSTTVLSFVSSQQDIRWSNIWVMAFSLPSSASIFQGLNCRTSTASS